MCCSAEDVKWLSRGCLPWVLILGYDLSLLIFHSLLLSITALFREPKAREDLQLDLPFTLSLLLPFCLLSSFTCAFPSTLITLRHLLFMPSSSSVLIHYLLNYISREWAFTSLGSSNRHLRSTINNITSRLGTIELAYTFPLSQPESR
jgi:hypothetical protein